MLASPHFVVRVRQAARTSASTRWAPGCVTFCQVVMHTLSSQRLGKCLRKLCGMLHAQSHLLCACCLWSVQAHPAQGAVEMPRIVSLLTARGRAAVRRVSRGASMLGFRKREPLLLACRLHVTCGARQELHCKSAQASDVDTLVAAAAATMQLCRQPSHELLAPSTVHAQRKPLPRVAGQACNV